MNENKTPAPKGVYNCAFVSASRSTKSNRAQHFVLNIRLRPLDCGVDASEVCEYFAELPLCFKTGVEYGFYDSDTKTNKIRKCTTADTTAAIKYARKAFPAWAEYVDALPDTASFVDAFAWFDQPHDDITVRADIKDVRHYTGSDGQQHPSYDANIYEMRGGKSVVDDEESFMADFGKTLKAAGVKFGGTKVAPKTNPASAIRTAARANRTPPPAPAKKAAPAATATREDAWEAYCNGKWIQNDPQGEKFNDMCDNIIGGDSTFATPEEWAKVVMAFKAG